MKAILETISNERHRSFASFESKGQRIHCPFHYHPEFELTLIPSSSGQRYVGDHIGRFAPGDLVLMGPSLPHMYVNDAAFSGPAHSIVLQFLPSCFGEDFFQLIELNRIRLLLHRSRLGLRFYGRTREKATEMLLPFNQLEGGARVVAFLNILETLARSREYHTLASPHFVPALSIYQGDRINQVCNLISRRFREGITQSDAARAARMSPSSFCRFFRRATNKTFREFLNEVRIGNACRALLETDKTVVEICYESGFNNLSNFNRQFLRLRKTSPRDYRRNRSPLI